jgi:hypothetical protein
MKHRSWFNGLLLFAMTALVWHPIALQADDAPANPPATQPATPPTDSPEAKEVRKQLLQLDADQAKMSLFDYRATFHTENDREAEYADYLAHDSWEGGKTEQAVRDKWGADADAQFCRLVGFTSREEDAVSEIKVDGDHATITWTIKGSTPQKVIKVNGRWLSDVHAMFDDWLAQDPNMESNKRSTIKVMQQARADIDAGKFDDADSFIKDLQQKLAAPADGN